MFAPDLDAGPLFSRFAHDVRAAGRDRALPLGRRSPRNRRERRAWLLIGVGVAAWTFGEIYYTAVLWTADEIPIPSPADAGYLLFPPLMLLGILALLRSRTRDVPGTLWADGITAALAVSAASAAIVFETVLDSASGQAARGRGQPRLPAHRPDPARRDRRRARGHRLAARPHVGAAVRRRSPRSGSPTRSTSSATRTAPTPPGAWFDAGWWLGLLLIGAAAWQPVAARARSRRRRAACAGSSLPLALRRRRPGAARLRLPRAAQPGRGRARRRLAARGDGAHDADLPRQRRDAARVARGGADRRAHRASATAARWRARSSASCRARRPPSRSCSCCSTSTASSTTTTPSATRRATRCSSASAAASPRFLRRPRHGVPHGRRRVLRAASARAPSVAEPLIVGAAAALSEHGEGFEIGCSYGAIELPARGAATSPRRCGSPTSACTRRRTPAACRRAARARTCCCARWPSATPSSRSHLGGVADLAEATALRLRLSHDEVEQVRHAAELHDVGKVAVPDAILTKPGPLDDDEWAFIRRHTLIGERIIGRRAGARRASPRSSARSHERWDGAGYPDGLAGEDDPARRAHRRGRRRVRRDDEPAPVLDRRATPEDALAELRALRGHAVRPRGRRRVHGRLARPHARRRRLTRGAR